MPAECSVRRSTWCTPTPDLADAVPATQNLLSKNVAGVIGPETQEIAAVEPILRKSSIVDEFQGGDTGRDHQQDQYLFRDSPSDSQLGVAMALYAHKKGYKNAVLLFYNDAAAQTRVRAPSTLGTFLRAFTFGHVRQLDAVAAGLLTGLAAVTPLLAGADQIAYLDIDDTVKPTYGYAKQGAGYGYSGVKGLNALLATLSTPLAAPVIAGCRLRKGSVNSTRGASRLLADALVAAKAASASGVLVVRADSAFYNRDVLAGDSSRRTVLRHRPARPQRPQGNRDDR